MKKDNFMLLNDYFCVKKYFNKKFIISVRYRITKVFGFYENYHYLNIFKTKPEQNIHQNVPNDMTQFLTPPPPPNASAQK